MIELYNLGRVKPVDRDAEAGVSELEQLLQKEQESRFQAEEELRRLKKQFAEISSSKVQINE